MRDALLPAALLCTALGLMLAFVPRRTALIAPGVLALVALASWALGVPEQFTGTAFLGCWVSVLATAALVYLPSEKQRPVLTYAAAANAGLWTGVLVSSSGSAQDLSALLLCVAIVPAGQLVVRRGWDMALKVAASWLIAVATLSAMLTLVPAPGYAPDHME